MKKKNIIQAAVVAIAMIFACGYTYIGEKDTPVVNLDNRVAAGVISCTDIPEWDEVEVSEPEVVVVAEGEPVDTEEDIAEEIYFDSLDLLADCVEAEAGNQPFEGKVKVAKVILNRVNDERYPDTIEEVIFQPGQFSVVDNGSIYRVSPTDETFEACRVAIEECSKNPDEDRVLYFRTGHYHASNRAAYQIGDHYFCY